MNKEPALIKPSRTVDALNPMSHETIFRNVLLGIETSVVLDLNILNQMQSVIQGNGTLESEGLTGLVSFFNENPVCITPGFAFGEADRAYVMPLREDYEAFMAAHCPGYVDTPKSTNDIEKRLVSRSFKELEEGDKHTLVIMYVAMLAIQITGIESPNSSPEEKFSKYLNYMETKADMVSAIEAEVAKYWFFDRRAVKDDAFKASCKTIRDNFNKGGKGEGRLQYSLNYARDLAYYRHTALQDGKKLDGVIQDCWLFTSDAGLVELAKSIYFYPHEGEAAKHVTFVRNNEQKSCAYWKYCDEQFFKVVERRRLSGQSRGRLTEQSWNKLFACQAELEKKVHQYWPERADV